MREKLLAEALIMIEESEDIHSLNLRKLARRVGCAHTNIYNYFSSMEDLLWHAVIPAIEQINDATVDVILRMSFPNHEERIRAYIKHQAGYALAHRGIYRFVWLEFPPSGSNPPDGFGEKLKEYWTKYLDCLFSGTCVLSPMDKNRIGSILSSYLHGEICHLIFHRTLTGNQEKATLRLVDYGVQLFNLLTGETGNKYPKHPL